MTHLLESFPVGAVVTTRYTKTVLRVEAKTASCAYVSEPSTRTICGKVVHGRARYTVSLKTECLDPKGGGL